MTAMRRMAAVLALLLIVTACGDDRPAGELPPDDAAVSGPAAGACPEGTPDCNDTPFGSDAPDGLLLDDGSGGDGGALPAVETLLADAADSTGLIAVIGYYVDSGDGPRLCEALAESFPPQCGGASIPLADISPVDPDGILTEGSTSWSDDPVYVVGEIAGGVLVPAGLGG